MRGGGGLEGVECCDAKPSGARCSGAQRQRRDRASAGSATRSAAHAARRCCLAGAGRGAGAPGLPPLQGAQ